MLDIIFQVQKFFFFIFKIKTVNSRGLKKSSWQSEKTFKAFKKKYQKQYRCQGTQQIFTIFNKVTVTSSTTSLPLISIINENADGSQTLITHSLLVRARAFWLDHQKPNYERIEQAMLFRLDLYKQTTKEPEIIKRIVLLGLRRFGKLMDRVGSS